LAQADTQAPTQWEGTVADQELLTTIAVTLATRPPKGSPQAAEQHSRPSRGW